MKLLYLLPILFFTSTAHAQNWVWDSVITDHNGGVKLCKDPWNFIYAYSSGNFNVAYSKTSIKKLDLNGNLIWQVDMPKFMTITSVAASWDQSVYMAGMFGGTPSVGGYTLQSKGDDDIWVARYTNTGTLIWIKNIGSRAYDEVDEICMSGNDVVITGSAGDTLDFMGTTVPKMLSNDFFVGKFNSSGVLQHVNIASPATQTLFASFGAECASDPAGNIYLRA